ncbi:MAG: CDP-alcohol phosphatidyltransferase family protein, partial [Acidobacteriaceae bacterium]
LGALFNRWGVMAPVLWVLAVISTVTVVHRILHTYQQTADIAPVLDAHSMVQPIVLRESEKRPDPGRDLPAPNAPRV